MSSIETGATLLVKGADGFIGSHLTETPLTPPKQKNYLAGNHFMLAARVS